MRLGGVNEDNGRRQRRSKETTTVESKECCGEILPGSYFVAAFLPDMCPLEMKTDLSTSSWTCAMQAPPVCYIIDALRLTGGEMSCIVISVLKTS